MQLRIPTLSRPYVRAALLDAAGFGVAVGLFMPFAGVMARRLGASELQVALLGMAPFIGFVLAGPFSRLSTYYAQSHLLYGLRALAALSLFGFGLVRGADSFVTLVMIVQVFGALSATGTTNLMRMHLRNVVRPSIIAAQRITIMLTSIGSAALAGRAFDVDQSSYRWVFPIAGLSFLVFGASMLHVPVRKTEVQQRKRPRLLEELAVLREDRLFATFLAVFFIGTLGEKLGIAITPIYFADFLNIRYEDVGLAVGVCGPVSAIFGYALWGRMVKKTEPVTVITIAMLAKTVRPFLWAVAGHMDAPFPWLVAGEVGFRFFVTGLEVGAIMTITSMARPGKGPLYTGLHFMLLGVRGMIGPALGYGLLKAGVPMPVIYVVIGGIVLTGAVALIPLRAAFLRSRTY